MAKTPKRPRDPNQLAKLITDIATGEVEHSQSSAAGSAGGRGRAEALPKKRRVEIARKAAAVRWNKDELKSADSE